MAYVEPLEAPPDDEIDDEPIVTHRRRRDDVEMDITPMIDMTFLLLIFFLVASRLDQPASVDLPRARHGDPVSAKNAVVLIVRGEGERVVVADGDGVPFPASDLEEQEERIIQYVEAGLAGTAPFDMPQEHVLIKAEGKVKHGEVSRVARAISRGSEGQRLHIAVLDSDAP